MGALILVAIIERLARAVVANLNNLFDFSRVVEKYDSRSPFNYMKRFRFIQMPVRTDIGVLCQGNEHLVNTVLNVLVGAKAGAMARVPRSLLLE